MHLCLLSYASVNVAVCLLQWNVYIVHLSSCAYWNTADSKALSHRQSAIKVLANRACLCY